MLILQTLAFAIIICYLLLCVVMYVFQARFLYFPSKELTSSPADYELKYRELWLTAKSGTRINAWYIPHDRPCGVILVCHGNAGNMSWGMEVLPPLHRIGFAIMTFDYQGYGRSGGRPNEKATQEDAQAAYDYLIHEAGWQSDQIVLYGQSLGGAVAAWLAEQNHSGAVILDAAFTSLRDVAAQYYPWLPTRYLTRYRYETLRHVGALACPVLVMHGPEDTVVPFEHGRRLFAAARGNRRFVELRGAHVDNLSVMADEWEDAVSDFLKDCFPIEGQSEAVGPGAP